MAGNFTVLRAFVYVPGALILSAQNNANEGNLYAAYNASLNNITGHQHTGIPGDGGSPLGPGSLNLAANYPWTGSHTWSAPGVSQFNNGLTILNGGTWSGSPTLVTPTIASFVNSQHNHQNAAGGGTLDAAAIAAGILPVVRGGTGVATSTGTGSVVLNVSPTLTTPVIGDFTTSQHNHQNAAGGGTLDISAATTGVLPVLRGGTGVTTSTGTTNTVLSNSPTLVTPTLSVPVIADFTSANHNHQNAAGGGTLDITAATTGTLATSRGGTNHGNYTAGSVLFAGAAGTIIDEDNANLFWDNATNRLGINTNTPAVPLDVVGQISNTGNIVSQGLVSGDSFDATTLAGYQAGRYSLSNSNEVGLDANISAGGVPTINSSYNVSSISNVTVALGAGGTVDIYQFRVNFNTALATTNYFVGTTQGPVAVVAAPPGGTTFAIPVGIIAKTTTYVELVICGDSTGVTPRIGHIDLIIMGGN